MTQVPEMVAPPGADIRLERGRYGCEPAGAWVVMDLWAEPVPAEDLAFCRPGRARQPG